MLSKVKSFGLIGLSGYEIEIQTDINFGMPRFDIVGLASSGIKESRDRIKSSIKNSGLNYPITHIMVNMAPADERKDGPIYDLPIAVGVLIATGQIRAESARDFVFLGELSLDGSVRKINGLLPILITAKQFKCKKIIIPKENSEEAKYIHGLDVYPVTSLSEVVNFLNGEINILPLVTEVFDINQTTLRSGDDFKYVHGQKLAKRALEIAAAGGHNVVMIGPPGSGKTMLAKCLPSILPNLTFEEALETTKIYSIAGILNKEDGVVFNRPIRSPHHTTTQIALTGGGVKVKPGEISLAHNGVLFLDELPEYNRAALETLRQPLEDGVISVSRLSATITYPANFVLVASMNPCPCGNFGSKKNKCSCSAGHIHNYLHKLSGPLMDRIDLHIEVDGVEYADLSRCADEEPSSEIKKRVDKARNIQVDRFKGTSVTSNGKMSAGQLKKYCALDENGQNLLKLAFEKLNLSARAYSRIIKVARTIADLDNSAHILKDHIAEAIGYRSLDNKFWR